MSICNIYNCMPKIYAAGMYTCKTLKFGFVTENDAKNTRKYTRTTPILLGFHYKNRKSSSRNQLSILRSFCESSLRLLSTYGHEHPVKDHEFGILSLGFSASVHYSFSVSASSHRALLMKSPG